MIRFRFRIQPKLAFLEKPLPLKQIVSHVSDLVLRNIQRTVKTYLKFTHLHGWNYRYTGNLAKSFVKGNVVANDVEARVMITSNAPQAQILEVGGEIRPKNAVFLTVPEKHTAIPFNMIDKASLWLGRGGLYDRDGNRVFRFAKSVHIPAYFYLTRALRKSKYEVNIATKNLIAGYFRS